MAVRCSLDTLDAYDAFVRHVNPALGQFLRIAGRAPRFVRASGSALFDDEGTRWDDWVAGFGALALGHDPPVVRDAVRAHIDRGVPTMLVESLNPFAGQVAERLVRLAGPSFGTAYLCNSGAEAVEAALKTAMAATGRSRVVYAARGFHGTTLGALACMARGPYRDPFASVVDRMGFREIPFDDEAALDAALAEGDVAAFLCEPIQMEAGAVFPSPGYLARARELCDRHGAIFVLDEVQTGLGRTGELFAFQREGAVPHVLVLAKALGAGVVPIGAAVMEDGLWHRAFGTFLRSEIHATTMGGNALACAVALAVLDTVAAPQFLVDVRARGDALRDALEDALRGRASVERVSLRGLIGGVRFRADHPWLSWEAFGVPELAGQPASGAAVVDRLYRAHVLAQPCGHDWAVVRIEPPLVVDAETTSRFVTALGDAARWLDENA